MLEHCVEGKCNDSSGPLSHRLHRCKTPMVMITDLPFAVDGRWPSRLQSTSRRLKDQHEPSALVVDGRVGDY